MLIDTHCHLDFPEFQQDRDAVIGRAKDNGIGYIINIGSSLDGSARSVEIAGKYDFIHASVGIHPHEADKFDDAGLRELRVLAKQAKVVAIGEIGLDYYKNYSKQENQKRVFLTCVNLARDSGLPLVIHNRQADEDTLRILKEAMPIRAVIHCFSADDNFLQECIDLGFFVSFTCNITYKKAENLRRLVKKTPLERLMLETDAPFLAPEAFRGKRNEPAYVKYLAEEVSKIKQVNSEEIAEITTKNAKDFFHLP